MRIQRELRGFLKLVVFSVAVSISCVFLTAGCHRDQSKDPLTVEERKWLTKHDGKIVLAHDPNAKPIDYLDDKGKFRGLAADYVHLIEKKLNFKFNIVHIKTWDEVIQKAKKKEIDVICTMTKTPAREKWLLFTKPYIVIPTVILVREDIKEDLTPEKMKGMKVTFTKGWVIDEYLRENYGYLDLVPSIDENIAMNRVSLGKVDAWVTALTSSSILIEKHRITNLRVAGEMDLQFKLAIASRKDWPILNQIMQRGLSLISKNERSAIFKKWIHIEGTGQISRKVWVGFIITAATILLIIFTILIWNRTLRRQVAQRTKELRDELDERRRAEEALQESENFLKTLLNAIPIPVFYKDKNGKYLGFNSAFETSFGETKERLIGKSVFDINPPELAEIYHAQDDELLKSGEVQRYESQVKDTQGKMRDVIFNKAVFTDNQGVVSGLIGAVLDITERKRAEEENSKLEAQLQQAQKMEAIGTLAGGIAHDFNNILAIILGNAELAADDVPDSNPAMESLKEIRKASIRAKDMIKQLLAFSRKTDEENNPINMAPIIKESMKMLRSAIPTSVEFEQHISDDPCIVMGDAAQINQIIMNLVTNAADAMSEKGGFLEVTLENINLQEEKSCFDWVLSPGAYVRLRMRDTGEGIEPRIMDRIFEPYYTTKEVGKGTGMGLSVIHGIVKRHGGGIRVESELGAGTVFEIYFPALEMTAEEEKKPEKEIKGGSERILFVDDEESLVDLNRQRLERLGYDVKSTTKPVEALEWFRADPDQFDVIITDMTMPRMTGDRLAAEILKIRPHIPVIICTGYSERMSAKKAESLGLRIYIEKPIDLRNLASSLREVLEEK